MRVTVLGAGSWGTTVATLVSGRSARTAGVHPTRLWARSQRVADEINEQHTNEGYLPGFTLPEALVATADLEQAVRHA